MKNEQQSNSSYLAEPLAAPESSLKANVETLAASEGLSMLETISLLQTGAAARKDEVTLEALCVLKREYI